MEWNKNQILEAIKPNILERLNVPLTAIFCSPDELILEEKRNGGNWEVRGTLNSQNKFGALLKANFLVVIRIENNGKKSVLYVDGVYINEEIEKYEKRNIEKFSIIIMTVIIFFFIKLIVGPYL
jgi:hypothetical protein